MQGIGKQLNRRLLLIVVIVFSLFMPESVLASQKNAQKPSNGNERDEYQATIKEEFEAPAKWLPGEIVDEDIYVVNEGSKDVFVKAQVNPKWFGQDELTKKEYELTFTVEATNTKEYAALIAWGEEVVLLSKGRIKDDSLSLGLPVVETRAKAHGKWLLLDEEIDEEGNLTFYYEGVLKAGEKTPLLIDYVQMNPKIEAKIMGTQTVYNKEQQEWETQYKINPSYSYENSRFLLTFNAWVSQVADGEIEKLTDVPSKVKQTSQPKTGDKTEFEKYIILMIGTIVGVSICMANRRNKKEGAIKCGKN